MIAVLGLGLLGVAFCQASQGVDFRQTPPAAQAPAGAPAAPVRAETASAASKSWDFKTGLRVKTIACSEDGKLLAIANGNSTMMPFENGTLRVKDGSKPQVEILHALTGKLIVALKLTNADEDAVLAATERASHFEVTALAFSPDCKLVAVGTSIGQVKLYDARTGALLRLLDDHAAKLADKKTSENWKRLERAMGSVASLAFSPDGRELATCGESFGDYSRVFKKSDRLGERFTGPGRLKVWDVKTESLKYDLIGYSHASSVAFSPDGNLLATAGSWQSDADSGTGVVIWNSATFAKLRTIPIESNGGTRAVAFSPDGKLLAISSLGVHRDKRDDPATSIISLANVESGAVQWQLRRSGPPEPVAFYDGAVLAMGDSGQSMWFYQVESGKILAQLTRPPDPRPGGKWNGFTFAKHGSMWLIGGEDAEGKGTVELIDPDGS